MWKIEEQGLKIQSSLRFCPRPLSLLTCALVLSNLIHDLSLGTTPLAMSHRLTSVVTLLWVLQLTAPQNPKRYIYLVHYQVPQHHTTRTSSHPSITLSKPGPLPSFLISAIASPSRGTSQTSGHHCWLSLVLTLIFKLFTALTILPPKCLFNLSITLCLFCHHLNPNTHPLSLITLRCPVNLDLAPCLIRSPYCNWRNF